MSVKVAMLAALCAVLLASCSVQAEQSVYEVVLSVRSQVEQAVGPTVVRREVVVASADDDDIFGGDDDGPLGGFTFSQLIDLLLATAPDSCKPRLQSVFNNQVVGCFDSFLESGFFSSSSDFFSDPTTAAASVDAICSNNCFSIILGAARSLPTISDCLPISTDDSTDDFDDDDDGDFFTNIERGGFLCARSSRNNNLCFNLLPIIVSLNSSSNIAESCQTIADYGSCLGTINALVGQETPFVPSVVSTCMNDASVDLTAAATGTESNPFQSSSASAPSTVFAAVAAAVVGAWLLA
eukprot:m.32767 g.32767  ORF g.32767 m.32767 type:complete len:296 (+) comp10819_c0_seq1:187-1074(+)